ncbi:hypothetical protein Bca4012_064855 [Brassica carinata]
MCMEATAPRALKSVLQRILLSSDGENLNSMSLLLYMVAIAVVFLLPATFILEKWALQLHFEEMISESFGTCYSIQCSLM